MFVATKLLSQQTYFYYDKRCVLSRQTHFCHDKHFFVMTKLLSQQKWYLWQFPPMIDFLPCLGDLTLEAHLSCPPERALRTSGSRGSRGRSPGYSSWQASEGTCWHGRPRQSWPQTPAGWRRRTWGPSAETHQHQFTLNMLYIYTRIYCRTAQTLHHWERTSWQRHNESHIQYKTFLAFKSSNHQAPSRLSDLIQPCAPSRKLHLSAGTQPLHLPSAHLNSSGWCVFFYQAPLL